MSNLNGEYYTQLSLDKNRVQVMVKSLIDKNGVLRYYDDDSTEKASIRSRKMNLTVKCQIFVDESEYNLAMETDVFHAMDTVNELIAFNDEFVDLPYTAMLCLSIHSLDREDDSPIASTTISLYDEDLKLRQGTYLLLLWPETAPDARFESTTPGLIDHEYLGKFNANKRILKEIESLSKAGFGTNDYHTNKSMENLRNKQHFLENSVPFSFLEIEVPIWGKDILFEDRMHKIKSCNFKCREIASKNGTVFKSKQFQKFFMPSDSSTQFLIVRDFDFDFERQDLVLDNYYQAKMDEGDASKLTPNKAQIKRLTFIIKRPNFEIITSKDKNLIWMFRYYLKKKPEALPKFLKSVYWYRDETAAEALLLLQQWTPINYDDAIFLLSRDFCANKIYTNKALASVEILSNIREYAVRILDTISSKEINFIILQLVISLRYETLNLKNSPLVDFLIKRCTSDKKMAMLCYWHLVVECENKNQEIKDWYESIKQKLIDHLCKESPLIHAFISNQVKFQTRIDKLAKHIKGNFKTAKSRKVELRKKLKKKEEIRDLEGLDGELTILNPDINVTTINPEEATVFKSNTSPFVLSYNTTKKTKYRVIYKNGDDMRTDQLIIQMITLMDHLTKDLNLDLRLTIYQVLAYGSEDGIMELVENSDTLQDILEKYGKLTNFFVKLTEDRRNKEDGDLSTADTNTTRRMSVNRAIDDDIIENYIESMAGYCVITYFLGIGDRHLENLMLDNTGRIFHIDFGFSMGEDPKMWNPPPFKLTKKMLEPLGDKDSPSYIRFVNKCISYFLYLRKHSKLILNLLYLMVDSGIIINPKHSKAISLKALEKVAEKFIIGENENNAEIYFNGLLKSSLEDVIAGLFDYLHILAVKVKN